MLLMVFKMYQRRNVSLLIDIQEIITNTRKIMIKIKSCRIFNITMIILNGLKIFLNLAKVL